MLKELHTRTTACRDIEVIHPEHPRGGFRCVLFDFDGTLSLIRQGWQQVMIPMMVEILLQTQSGEPVDVIEACVREFVERLTGKQTIYQMIRLAQEVEKRGGKPLDPLEYKRLYHERLWAQIRHRVAGLKEGRINPEEMMVPGSEALLQALRARGLTLYLASGTDLHYVRDECAALGLTHYFNGGIYGAVDEYWNFSKKMLVERIFRENDLHGPQLLTFGDGFVEIENTKEVGGVAVGVASDEVGRVRPDPWKRNRLIQAGADVIVPHYRRHQEIVAYLFGETE